MRVKDIMNTKIMYLTVDRELSLSDILNLEDARNIPVVNHDLTLAGLITYRELVKALVNNSNTVHVKDIMLPHVTWVTPETPLKGAIEVMVLNKFSCLPVVDPNKKLMGVVTDIDLLKRLLVVKVEDIMSTKFTSLKEDEQVSTLDVLNMEKIRNIPVVGNDGKLVGMITYKELLNALAKKLNVFCVKDFMIKEVKTVTPKDLFSEAVNLMIVNKMGCLPVTNSQGILVGVITEDNLLRNLSNMTAMPSDFYAVR